MTTMEAERWRRLSRLFDQAVELEGDARRRFIERECANDSAMCAKLQQMLDADAQASAFDDGIAAAITLPDVAADDDDEALNAIGMHLGPWRLMRMLGRGGMGSVHQAVRTDESGQQAAIKRLHRRWDGSGQAQRFLQERRILANLSHPNIPRLIDHGLDDDGQPWFALEYVDGATLTEWADARRLDLRARIDLFREVCAAVQHAHGHFVVHRDLKPANIVVDEEGHPKVLDFGVAKFIDGQPGETRTGMFAGFTPEYAAPEQIDGGPITAATDVHALGVMLYELLCGQLPFRFGSNNLRQAAEAITSQTATQMQKALTTGDAEAVARRMADRRTDARAFHRFVRGDLTRIIQTALSKEPERRYPSVQALSDDLHRFLKGQVVSVSGDTFGYRTRKFVQRNRWGVAMAVLAVIAVGAGIAGILMKTREAQAAAAQASAEAARAEREARRARSDAESLASTNEFLRSVFEGGMTEAGGRPDITLQQAMDAAVERVGNAGEVGPQAKVRFLLAAAGSYSGMGQDQHAEALTRQAMAIQQAELPDSVEDKARVLAMLAWLRIAYEPEQSLAMARESLRLERSLDPPSLVGLSSAYSALTNAQLFSGDEAGAITTLREARAQMRVAGVAENSQDMATMAQIEAISLAGLKRWDEAFVAHREAIAIRERALGPDSVGAAQEHLYYGNTLLRAGRNADALAEIERAAGPIHATLPAQSDSPMQSRYLRGVALLRVGRFGEAAAELLQAHEYGRTHPFHDRQALVAWYLAQARARLGDCANARATLADMAARGIPLPDDKPPPLQGTGCRE
ncbi:MAG: serine/threonine protein kinase [Xanthomonadaceae bacterium]|nr:serine/threonine protein kinase [Xanthomonadaceae bacterium]